MTDRHIHCVYFKYNAKNDLKGYCLLKQKRIKMGYGQHCQNIVLRPSVLLSYYIKNPNIHWEEADKKAADYIKNAGFNDYPKKNNKVDKELK